MLMDETPSPDAHQPLSAVFIFHNLADVSGTCLREMANRPDKGGVVSMLRGMSDL